MLDLTNPIELQRPPTLHFGNDTLGNLKNWINHHGYKQPLIIADPFNATRLDVLGIGQPSCFGEVIAEPDIDMLNHAVASAENADVIVGFGGGSAMDLAKLVAVMAGQGSKIAFEDISGPGRAPARKLGLVQIPTTSGTGSEVGTRALITDPETKSKVATESNNMLADMVIIDPTLSVSVPAQITAATGVDALAHCVEAFTSKRSHPMIDHYALEGIRLVGKYLVRAVNSGDDLEARGGMALASFYGGICLGPVNTTAGHAVSYPLGVRHGLAHGIANALMFPHILAINMAAVPEKTGLIAEALNFSATNEKELLVGAVDYCKLLGLDMKLRNYLPDAESLPDMAKDAISIRRLLDWNPVDLSEADILALYQRAW